MPIPMPNGKQQYCTTAGTPLVGGRLYTYAAGTSTPKATWSDAAGTTPNANPIIMDARGEATVFFSGAYKLELRDAANAVIWTVDQFVAADTSVLIPDGRVTLPSGTTVDLGTTTVRSVDISGTSAIQSFGTTSSDGASRFVRFTGACSLVHNATSMILPAGANIQCAAGDSAIVQCLGSGNWVVLAYQRTAQFDLDARRTTVASAATTDLSTTVARSIDISGTTTITSLGAAAAGFWRLLRFTGSLTLTHNATSLILPDGVNIVTTAGDTATVISLGSGNWFVSSYTRASQPGFLAYRTSALTSGTSITGYALGATGYNDATALNLTTGVWTAPQTGTYTFQAAVKAVNTTASQLAMWSSFLVDGTAVHQLYGTAPAATLGNPTFIPFSLATTLRLNAGQTVAVGIQQVGLGALSSTVYADTATFSAARVR